MKKNVLKFSTLGILLLLSIICSSCNNNNNSAKFGDISKFKKFEWTEIENIIDTNDVDSNSLDEHNKILCKLYDSRFFGSLMKDNNYHKFYLLHSNNKEKWKDIFELPYLTEDYFNDYYLYIAYNDSSYSDIIKYDLIDFNSRFNNGCDIVDDFYCSGSSYDDNLFVFTHEYLKDIAINPNLQNMTKRGCRGDIYTIIYPHLFTDYNMNESMFRTLMCGENLIFTDDTEHWDNYALSTNFLSKHNEENGGLIREVIYNGDEVDYLHDVDVDVKDINTKDYSFIFSISDDSKNTIKNYKAKFIINDDFYLEDIIITET